MKRQSILFILLLLLTILFCYGCSGESPTESASEQHPSVASSIETADTILIEKTEHTLGIFEGLEGNHTAIFSFDGIETAFHFEDPAVQNVLFEAIVGSPYTLSYYFDETTNLLTIYEISE